MGRKELLWVSREESTVPGKTVLLEASIRYSIRPALILPVSGSAGVIKEPGLSLFA